MTGGDTAWPAGTPCWVDLMTTDLDAARTFYGSLFGWMIEVGPPEVGGYSMATVGGKNVAGLGPVWQPGAPAMWNTYLATEDIEETTGKITAAGGTILIPSTAVFDSGMFVTAVDPAGGVFSLWQAGTHPGFGLANESNSVIWNELYTRDFAAAKDFYAAIFGYTYQDMSEGSMQYAMLQVDGNVVGGLGSMPEGMPAETPSHWRLYFATSDTDAAVAKALELGGTVVVPPTDMPYGRWADLQDPQGALFAVLKPPHFE